jgi:hypothetical protein
VNAFTLTYRITNHKVNVLAIQYKTLNCNLYFGKTEFSFPPGACVSEATQQLIKGSLLLS